MPPRVDLVVVDIDSYDAPLLEQMLSCTRPRMVIVEVNPDIPPPLRFTVEYLPRREVDVEAQDSVQGDTELYGFFGASITHWVAMLQPHGYALVGIENHDAIFVETLLVPAIEAAGISVVRSAWQAWTGTIQHHNREPRLHPLLWCPTVWPHDTLRGAVRADTPAPLHCACTVDSRPQYCEGSRGRPAGTCYPSRMIAVCSTQKPSSTPLPWPRRFAGECLEHRTCGTAR